MCLNKIIFLMVSMLTIVLFTPKVCAETVSPPEYGYGYSEGTHRSGSFGVIRDNVTSRVSQVTI